MTTLSTLLFFDISTGEVFIVILVLFLIFGPQKMPEIARKIGKVINQMKHATSELSKEFNEESKEIRKTLDDETKSIRKSFDDTKKDFAKENKNIENELSIKTDIKQRRNKPPEKQTDNQQHISDKEKKDNQNE